MNILAGDLGGTKTVLAIYSCKHKIIKIHHKYYLSKDWDSFDLILENYLNSIPKEIEKPHYGCIAIAGRVIGNICKTTNLDWVLNSELLTTLSSLKNIQLINDFSSLVYGIPNFEKSQFIEVQGDSKKRFEKNQSIAILGAGTGLGMARGIITKEGIKALPSEGGHSEFSARSSQEWDLSQWLKNDLNLKRLSIERVVSGTGLGHIARWRLTQNDAKEHQLNSYLANQTVPNKINLPSLVSKFANQGDPIMTEVMNIWLSAYGSAAGDMVLQELCSGGLWIAGGASAKNIKGIQSMAFLNAFQDKGRFSSYLQEIPLIVLTDEEASLFSSACKARKIAESNGRLS